MMENLNLDLVLVKESRPEKELKTLRKYLLQITKKSPMYD